MLLSAQGMTRSKPRISTSGLVRRTAVTNLALCGEDCSSPVLVHNRNSEITIAAIKV